VREQIDVTEGQTDKTSELKRKTGHIDYESFKKALVYISAFAQEKLGGGD